MERERPPEQVIERGGTPAPSSQQPAPAASSSGRPKTPVKHSASSSAKDGADETGEKRRSLRSRLPSVGLGGSSKAADGQGKEGGSGSHHPAPPVQPKDPDAQLEGWLKKRGTRIPSHWSDRYLVLKGDQLLYYLKPTDQVIINHIHREGTAPKGASRASPRFHPLDRWH